MDVPTSSIECLVLKLSLPKRKSLSLVTAYRPPAQNIEVFLDELDVILSSVQQSHVLLVGDFNAKHAAWFQHQPTDTEGDHLKTFTDGLNLHQLINSPTYNTTSDHPSRLDLIFTNRPAAVLSTATLPPVADHSPVLFEESSVKEALPHQLFSLLRH